MHLSSGHLASQISPPNSGLVHLLSPTCTAQIFSQCCPVQELGFPVFTVATQKPVLSIRSLSCFPFPSFPLNLTIFSGEQRDGFLLSFLAQLDHDLWRSVKLSSPLEENAHPGFQGSALACHYLCLQHHLLPTRFPLTPPASPPFISRYLDTWSFLSPQELGTCSLCLFWNALLATFWMVVLMDFPPCLLDGRINAISLWTLAWPLSLPTYNPCYEWCRFSSVLCTEITLQGARRMSHHPACALHAPSGSWLVFVHRGNKHPLCLTICLLQPLRSPFVCSPACVSDVWHLLGNLLAIIFGFCALSWTSVPHHYFHESLQDCLKTELCKWMAVCWMLKGIKSWAHTPLPPHTHTCTQNSSMTLGQL